jgi:hypothetical protein
MTDVDNDGDLDLFFVGYDNSSNADVAIFINNANSNTYSANVAPGSPANLASMVDGNSVQLSWEAATDDHTPQVSLQYNIYIGTESGLGNVLCAQSITDPLAANFGFHMMPKQGNCQTQMNFAMNGLADGVYFWSVQAIDQSGAASVFADEQYFDVGNMTTVHETNSSFAIYPNPASDVLHISNSTGKVIDFTIFSSTGQLLISGNSQENIDVSALKSGLYLIEIKTDESTCVEKLQIK